MNRVVELILALVCVVAMPGVATAFDGTDGPAVKNVRVRAHLPGTESAVSIAFLELGRRDVAFVSSEQGLAAFDVTNLDAPRLLDRLTKQELALPGDDPAGTFWENEDVNVDPKRKLVFMAREVASFGREPGPGVPVGSYVVSVADPANLEVLSFAHSNTSHTTSCVNDCRYLWSAGYNHADDNKTPSIWVTDVRDPLRPVTSPTPVDVRLPQGDFTMTHDVQVDAAGVAWVSGSRGTHGYWTQGLHLDPATGRLREATAFDPIPYAGGSLPAADVPSGYTHNSFRPVGARLKDGPPPTRENPAGSLLLQTEEDFGDPDDWRCKGQGRFVISSLKGTESGFGEMRTVGTWRPEGQEGDLGDVPSAFCSAHYFDVHRRIVVQSFYQQGTRFLDITDPSRPTQIAYYRPDDAMSWQPYWHRGAVFVADHRRGVEILSLTRGAYEAQEKGVGVRLVAPIKGGGLPLQPHPAYGHACPMPPGRSCTPGSCC